MSDSVFTYEAARAASREYFGGDDLAAKVFLDKYALRDDKQELAEKTPEDMHKRIAKEFARVENGKFKKPLTEEAIFAYLDRFAKIVPQGSPMYGIGNNFQFISLSNCFVVESPADSYSGICKIDEELVQISKRRGGVGVDISNFRPAGAITHNAARTSTGITPLMTRYSNSIREVGQNGRRGAEMQSISIHHPEAVKLLADGVEPQPIVVNKGTDREIHTTTEFYDPTNNDFVSIKYDITQITGANISIRLTDEFLTAVDAGTDFEQRWPVESKTPSISKRIDAGRAWKKIVRSAWQMAEPGLLFWDNILRESPADCYASKGFSTISTNPCVTADTIVYVADGRGDVRMEDLVAAGKDVSVFCYDNSGKVSIRTMRNPRLTGQSQQIYKVILEDGHAVRVTGSHKFRLTDGTYREAKDLQPGDSVKTLTKYEAPIIAIENKNKYRVGKKDYLWLNNGFGQTKSEHRIVAEHSYGRPIPIGFVVHHKDFNTQNNAPDNLEVMTRESHDRLHGDLMRGDNNPMRRAETEWSDEKWAEYSANMSEAVSGELNGRYSGFDNDVIGQHAIGLTRSLNRRFSKWDWIDHTKGLGLPQHFSDHRQSKWASVTAMGVWAADQVGIRSDIDPRLQKTFNSAVEQGYNTEIINGVVTVYRKCEQCNVDFPENYFKREIGFCSRKCSNHYLNARGTNSKRTSSINATYGKKATVTKVEQVKIYTELRLSLNRPPLMKEWENKCKEKKVSYRLKTKNGFQNFKEVKTEAEVFNHRVVSVTHDGQEDVFNGTVDDFHNFFVGGWESKTKNNKRKSLYINNLNCGEIPLSAYDSCRLLLLNLFGFVKSAFKDGKFDWKEFYETTKVAQRLMDDLIDLEEEAILGIIKKIKTDPEATTVKSRELDLWQNILTACRNGRRTGTGITALGDAIAALGLGYGSDEGIAFTERVYKTLKFAAYTSSIEMAKELGAFPVWDHELEKDNPFLNRFRTETVDLGNGEIIDGEALWQDMKKHGRRNIALLTTAPAGTVSIETRTTSGIEPLFMISYKRRKKGNPGDVNFRSDFKDQSGDHWQEFAVFHTRVWDWAKANGFEEELRTAVDANDDAAIEAITKKSPWFGSCASEIVWTQRVKLQAAAQRHVDHSISSTLNLPNDATPEQVDEIYRTAWKSGCKGVTIYRDGCRTGVLVKETKVVAVKKGIQKTAAPERPETLPCDVFHIKAKGEEYFVIVGLFDGTEPFEVFAGKNGMINKDVHDGYVTKKARGKYDAVFKDGSELKNIADHLTDEEEAVTRAISMALRHGADISFAVHQLEKTRGSLFGFSKALARSLKKYIPDDDKAKEHDTGEICSEVGCGGKIIRQDGCSKCLLCATSKCG